MCKAHERRLCDAIVCAGEQQNQPPNHRNARRAIGIGLVRDWMI